MERALAAEGVEAVIHMARRHRGPIVEPTADPGLYAVTFVFIDRAGQAQDAALICPALPDGFARLRHLGGHVFAGTHALPRGTRVKYHFTPDPPADLDSRTLFDLEHSPQARRVDRFNPTIDRMAIPELRLLVFESVLALPGARPAPWSEPRPGVPEGEVETATFRSESLGGEREVALYRPPGYQADARPYPLVVLLDGQHPWWKAPALFDNLVADGAAVPFVAALVGVGRFSSRFRELAGSPRHVRFLVAELLPWLAARSRIRSSGHVVAGYSAGGLAAAYAALEWPELFPDLVAISATFQLTTRSDPLRPPEGRPWLVDEYERAERLPRRVFLASGLFEGRVEPSIHAQNERLAGVLRKRGVSVRFRSGPTGHDVFSARAHLAEGLAWTLSPR